MLFDVRRNESQLQIHLRRTQHFRTHRVVERPDVTSADDSIGKRIKTSRVGVGSLSLLELLKESVLLGQLGEDARKVVTLLRGGLGAVFGHEGQERVSGEQKLED